MFFCKCVIVRNSQSQRFNTGFAMITDKPSQPEGPMVVRDIRRDTVTIEWKPPADDGGLEISKYSVEKFEKDIGIWTKVADVSKEVDSYCVQRLQEDSEYMFRVFAQNPVGVSEPLQSSPITVKKQEGIRKSSPDAPSSFSSLIFLHFVLRTMPTPDCFISIS